MAMPAVAGSAANILAFWDYYDTAGAGHGVACRALDPSGNLTAGQLSVSTDAADTVAATQLSNNNIAVTWQVSSPSYAIHSVIVKPDCTALSNVVGISATVGADGLSPHRAHVAGTGNFVLYAWIQDGDVHVRTSTLSGSVFGNDITLIPKTATMDVEALRVFPMGGGFGLAARWITTTANGGPGKIELFQVSTAGQLVGAAQLVTDQSLSDFFSGQQAISAGTNGQGLTLIAWHVCDASASTGSCDLCGRLERYEPRRTGYAGRGRPCPHHLSAVALLGFVVRAVVDAERAHLLVQMAALELQLAGGIRDVVLVRVEGGA